MAEIDRKFKQLVKEITKKGRRYEDPNRKDIFRLEIPRYNFEYDLKDGFPALTLKKLYWKGVVGELLWFLRGDTNIKYLQDNNIHIWDKDAYNWYSKYYNTYHPKYPQNRFTLNEFISRIKEAKNLKELRNFQNLRIALGDLGRVYGTQWRDWNGIIYGKKNVGPSNIDQISNLIKNLKEKPLSTEHYVTAWNPAELDEMALPPCHKGFQIIGYRLSSEERIKIYNSLYKEKIILDNFNKVFPSKKDIISNKMKYMGRLAGKNIPKYGFDLVWEQRSVDTFLGLPFNIASYALLAHIIGYMTNMVPGKIYGDLRKVHIYEPHMESVKELLNRSDKLHNSKCELIINEDIIKKLKKGLKHIDDKTIEIKDFNLSPYSSHPAIKEDMFERDV